jgi:hypothetical protein
MRLLREFDLQQDPVAEINMQNNYQLDAPRPATGRWGTQNQNPQIFGGGVLGTAASNVPSSRGLPLEDESQEEARRHIFAEARRSRLAAAALTRRNR